jgi:hypothetical protein
MMILRPFNENDWSAFAGAEATPDGQQPRINKGDWYVEGIDAMLIADANGVQAIIADADGTTLSLPGTFALAVLVAESLPLQCMLADLKALGFQEIN